MTDTAAAVAFAESLAKTLVDAEQPTVREVLADHIASRNWCDGTLHNLKHRGVRIGATLGSVRARNLNRGHRDRLVAALESCDLAPRTINGTLDTLNAAMSYAHECERIPVPYHFRHVKAPDPDPCYLLWPEYERLESAAPGALRIFAALCGRAGLRHGEARALRWEDIAQGDITVRHTMHDKGELGPPKGRKVVTLPMFPELARMLKEWRHLRGPWVVCHEDGEPWHAEEAPVQLAALAASMNPPPVCADGTPYRRKVRGKPEAGSGLVHVLRHTFCSHLVAQGHHVRHIQEWARHSSLAVTERYMHVRNDDLRDAMRKVGE